MKALGYLSNHVEYRQRAPPLEWRGPIQKAWVYLDTNLFCVNPTSVSMLNIWSKYAHYSLIDIPETSAFPMTIQDFETMQKTHMKNIRDVFANE